METWTLDAVDERRLTLLAEVLALALKETPHPLATPTDGKPAADGGKRASTKRPARRATSKVHAH